MKKIERAESSPGTTNLAFAILCPARNLGGLRTTVRTLTGIYPEHQRVCILPEEATDKELAEFNQTCPSFRGGKTVQSLANLGFQVCQSEWVMTLMAGNVARPGTIRLYKRFGRHNTDILYAVIQKKWLFEETGFIGFMAHRETFLELGGFAEIEENLGIAKLSWCLDAVEAGCSLKGLLGVAM